MKAARLDVFEPEPVPTVRYGLHGEGSSSIDAKVGGAATRHHEQHACVPDRDLAVPQPVWVGLARVLLHLSSNLPGTDRQRGKRSCHLPRQRLVAGLNSVDEVSHWPEPPWRCASCGSGHFSRTIKLGVGGRGRLTVISPAQMVERLSHFSAHRIHFQTHVPCRHDPLVQTPRATW